MPADALRNVRERIEGGLFSLAPDTARAVVARVDDLIAALDMADRALARLPKPAIGEAAAKLAFVRYISGRSWRRYVAENPDIAAAATEVRAALDLATAELGAPLARFLGARLLDQVGRGERGAYVLPCAACGGDALTLTLDRASPEAQERLVVSSLSPVTVFRSLAGPRMQDLVALLGAGEVSAVVQHLRDTQPGGCDAYCPACTRIYCKDHYSIEAEWSGSWHEGTYATCPLGHEHTID